MTQIPEGYMRNGRGELIPMANVREQDKLEDELVTNLAKQARHLEAELTRFKGLVLSEAADFKELVAEEYGATKGGQRGNMTLRSFDGTLEAQIAVGEYLSFGAEIHAAKTLIDECVRKWSAGASENLRALVDHAFQVNKEGAVDTQRVLGLRRLDIQDEDWKRAMDAISDAVRVTGSKTYVRFYSRDPETEERTPISLDIARVKL